MHKQRTHREGWPTGSPTPLIHKDASANSGDLKWEKNQTKQDCSYMPRLTYKPGAVRDGGYKIRQAQQPARLCVTSLQALCSCHDEGREFLKEALRSLSWAYPDLQMLVL